MPVAWQVLCSRVCTHDGSCKCLPANDGVVQSQRKTANHAAGGSITCTACVGHDLAAACFTAGQISLETNNCNCGQLAGS